ncbi:AMP-dependent synthetase/ligase [Aquihabitans sp. G128]|uniref:AMP-dependent synthetase/ligase n=1 Tax=Aquihabitans sp. G128 TaxID=2849779 RepID=UPI001C221B2C|nr:AMP-dependent synthetase/ligase [Aquihabitans sp. G128]QXC59724.1 AMP-dependent synthetase/ligase [Aquihabitans sp. G128]
MSQTTDHATGRTIAQAFLDVVEARGSDVALRGKEGDAWRERTFAQYADEVARVAAGLRAQGVERGDRVVLMMRNMPEFHVLDVAALMIGATPISIYNSSAPDQIEYLVGHSGATVGIVEDDSFLARFEPVRDQLTSLRSLGVVQPGERAADFTWDDLLANDPIDLAAAAADGSPDDLVTVIYTSGTTGPPKGVQITNANVLFVAEATRQLMAFDDAAGKRVVSYLPMAHIAERTVSHYSNLVLGYEVSCCPEPGKIAAYCAEVRPNVLFGVPRVWEKIHAGLVAALSADPEKAQQFDEAVEASRPIALRRSWGEATAEDDATWAFLDEVAFTPVRALLGLDQLEVAVTGAAPIPADLLTWFRAIGVPLSEVYGMSENTGLMTWTPERIKPGTVGPAAPGTEVAIAEDGEVITRGPHVFRGYLDDPEKTAEALSDDGWLHTGDIGELDDDGYLKIVDRKKELIITAGGKNISPANLEAALKMIPLVGQAAAIGDQRPFVSALVVLDPDTAPVWAKQHGIDFETLQDLADNTDVIAAVEAGLEEVMAGFNNAERVKKVKVLGEEWLPDSEILTPTSKLKRRGVNTAFAKEIEELYAR